MCEYPMAEYKCQVANVGLTPGIKKNNSFNGTISHINKYMYLVLRRWTRVFASLDEFFYQYKIQSFI